MAQMATAPKEGSKGCVLDAVRLSLAVTADTWVTPTLISFQPPLPKRRLSISGACGFGNADVLVRIVRYARACAQFSSILNWEKMVPGLRFVRFSNQTY